LKNLQTDLPGAYQRENTITALQTLKVLKKDLPVEEKDLRNGFANVSKNTGLLGRWQVLRQHPLTVCDTGHNRDAFLHLVRQIRNTPYKNLFMVLGFVNDKDPGQILQLLPEDAVFFFTRASIPRAMDAEELRQRAADAGLQGKSYSTVKEAVAEALSQAGKNDMVFIGGSTFVVAEVV